MAERDGSSSALSAILLGSCPIARVTIMDFAQVFVFDLGWVFFAIWGMLITAVSLIAFRSDIAELVSHRK
jgi:hypothetical protein